MHQVYYQYQVNQFVAIHTDDSDVIQYGTVRQVNCTIFMNKDDELTNTVEYLVELYGADRCPKTITATEAKLTPSPMPLGG